MKNNQNTSLEVQQIYAEIKNAYMSGDFKKSNALTNKLYKMGIYEDEYREAISNHDQ